MARWKLFNELKLGMLLSLFRIQCRCCGDPLVYINEIGICNPCKEKISIYPSPTCPRCGRFLGDWHPLCGECLIIEPPFRKHVSFAVYEEQLRDMILAYKYGGFQPLKHFFSDCYLLLFQNKINENCDYIVPVPPDKSRDRHFDPILQMARLVSKKLNIPLMTGNLVKIRRTEPQAGLSRSKRLENLNGAFKLLNPPAVAGKTILLMDDIYTTGTTIITCAQQLTRHNTDVLAITLARS